MDESLERLMRKRQVEKLLQKIEEHGPIKGPDLRQRVKHQVGAYDAMALTNELVGLGLIAGGHSGPYTLTDEGQLWLLAAGGSPKTVAHDAPGLAPATD